MMVAKRRTGVSPQPTSGVLVRPLLAAGLAFMDAVPRNAFRIADAVACGSSRTFVMPGLMPMPATRSRSRPPAWSRSGRRRAADGSPPSRRASCASRPRRGPGSPWCWAGCARAPRDDRFLAGSIATGKVVRSSGNRGSSWQPSPTVADRLSDIVLSLFVADILAHREEYETNLCVCDLCARVSLTPGAEIRTRCPQHRTSLLR